MAKKSADDGDPVHHYRRELRELQIALVTAQRHLIRHGHRVLVIFEGRDAAGKDGTIKRVVEHLSPRETRVVALGRPSDREQTQWYFQRYVPFLPAAGEFVLFNRSWYNRVGVERVMQFCTEEQTKTFLDAVVPFERMLVDAGLQFIKYYLDISRDEQKQRLKKRESDPLTQWKVSPIDEVALKRWDDYTDARDRMLKRTDHHAAPWLVVQADDKKAARLNVIRDLVQRIECPDRNKHLATPDRRIVRPYKGMPAKFLQR
ncbi:MAG: polyphosphate kinase 2 [Nevskiaceae bacterium]|nr:MAG: polyphosphate kinase 2 [Nevskiaceae bacterium]